MEIEGLVLAVLGGDSRAWRKFAARLRTDLLPILRRSLDEEDASDVVQMTLAIVHCKLPEFEWRSANAFRGWVRTIARTQMHELLRQRGRWHRQAGAAEILAIQRIPSPKFGSRLDQARQGELVERAIPKLATPYRVVIENDLDDGENNTLAEQQKIAPSTVKTRRHRAHEKLRRLVRKRPVGDRTPKSP